MINSLYPGFVVIYYTANNHSHKMTLPVVPQTIPMVPGTNPNLMLNDGTTALWTTAVGAFVDHLLPLYPNTCSFNRAEIYGLSSYTGDPFYVSGSSLVGDVGTAAVGLVAYSQAVFSFRTNQGGILKLYLMEQTLAPNQIMPAPAFGGVADVVAIVNHVVGIDNFIMGRDGGEPMTCIRVTTKTNDALRKRYVT